ncbi:MAG TPA: hypothetical protein VHB72_00845 [Candidatus Saccharimonadales bacterium]|nr:hypothetical protein [Candidatus Saccharimonadales bacterium]
MKEIIGIAAVILSFVAYAPYFRDIFARKAKPHPYSWFVWGLTSILIFALQISHGGGAGAYTTASVAFISFAVCLLAYRNDGIKDITTTDTAMLIMALIATALWLFAKQPTLSMILLIAADMCGFAPSIRRAWYNPYGETATMWGTNAMRHTLSIFALQKYSLLTLLNPVVWAIGNFCFTLMLIFRRQTKL